MSRLPRTTRCRVRVPNAWMHQTRMCHGAGFQITLARSEQCELLRGLPGLRCGKVGDAGLHGAKGKSEQATSRCRIVGARPISPLWGHPLNDGVYQSDLACSLEVHRS